MDITIGQFIDAIEKNGFPQGFGGLFQKKIFDEVEDYEYMDDVDPEEFVYACAYGQGLINLGVIQNVLVLNRNSFEGLFYVAVWELNDQNRFTPQEIAQRLRNRYSDVLDRVLEAEFEPFDYGNVEAKRNGNS